MRGARRSQRGDRPGRPRPRGGPHRPRRGAWRPAGHGRASVRSFYGRDAVRRPRAAALGGAPSVQARPSDPGMAVRASTAGALPGRGFLDRFPPRRVDPVRTEDEIAGILCALSPDDELAMLLLLKLHLPAFITKRQARGPGSLSRARIRRAAGTFTRTCGPTRPHGGPGAAQIACGA